MPSLDLCLAAHVVHTVGALTLVIEAGVLDEHLFDDGRTVVAFAREHFARYGKAPDVDTVKRDTKVTVPAIAEVLEPVPYYIDRVKARALDKLAAEQTKRQVTALDRLDTPAVVEAAKGLLSEIGRQNLMGEPIDDWTRHTAERWAEYERVKQIQGGITGVPTPWPLLDDLTQGVNPGDFWSIVARPQSGKTWLACLMALHAWRFDHRPLFISMEMSRQRIKRRLDALYAKMPYGPLKRGQLGMHLEPEYQRALTDLEQRQSTFPIVTRKRVKTPQDIAILIEQLRPSVVFIDGMYKLVPSRGGRYQANWERIMALVDEIQELAQEKDTGIVGTTQLSRGAEKKGKKKRGGEAALGDVAFADAIGMNCDVMLAILPDAAGTGEKESVIQVLKNREDESKSFVIQFDLEAMDFGQLHEWTPRGGGGGDGDDDAGGGGGGGPTSSPVSAGDASVEY